MKLYREALPGRFLARPNRFIAQVLLSGREERCHVKNTGRCRELLVPDAQVWCAPGDNPARKTRFDLVAVQKGSRLINLDSQAPNRAAMEWLQGGGLGPLEDLRAEQVHGDSRFDFAFTKDGRPSFLEVKGVTLECGGVVRFPDAPTERGTKHLHGLSRAAQEGYGAYVLFVIQMDAVRFLEPNEATDPAFAAALRQAAQAGVALLAMDCTVTPESMTLRHPVEIRL